MLQEESGEVRKEIWEMFFTTWDTVISGYSKLTLTEPSDRLHAVAGLANIAKLSIPGRYLSGIWEFDLGDGLFWRPANYPMERGEDRFAPSWSWASSTREVLLAGYDSTEPLLELARICRGTTGLERLHVRGQVHRCYVSQSHNLWQFAEVTGSSSIHRCLWLSIPLLPGKMSYILQEHPCLTISASLTGQEEKKLNLLSSLSPARLFSTCGIVMACFSKEFLQLTAPFMNVSELDGLPTWPGIILRRPRYAWSRKAQCTWGFGNLKTRRRNGRFTGFKQRQICNSDSNHFCISITLPVSADIVFTTLTTSFANIRISLRIFRN